MLAQTGLLLAVLASSLPFVKGSNVTAICQQISQRVSNASAVIYPLNPNFDPDTHHWYNTSSQIPTCVLEVGSTQDTSTALRIIGRSRTPFAVQSGGHSSNPGFSSTTGVHISLSRLKQVQLAADKSTVEIGTGQTWAGVFQELQGSGYNVVGGRTVGPGVGGFTLGGGFSWKTNQHGLTCDTVKRFNVVLPDGTITQVDATKPDLFFALKGGLNRFGIVTSAEFYTHPQPPVVYGGLALYDNTSTTGILNATSTFMAQNTDPKAQVITTLSGSGTGTTALVIYFYDGPDRPASFTPFDSFVPILSTVSNKTFSDFIQGFPSGLITNTRGTFNTLSTSNLTPNFLTAVKSEVDALGLVMAEHSGTSISYDIEPFLPTYGQKATDSAYPHADSPLPLNLYFAWTSPADDAFWYNAMRTSVQNLKNVAIQEGIYKDDFTAYPNYAISNTTAVALYGARNAARLRSIRRQVDPQSVMDLAGGFQV